MNIRELLKCNSKVSSLINAAILGYESEVPKIYDEVRSVCKDLESESEEITVPIFPWSAFLPFPFVSYFFVVIAFVPKLIFYALFGLFYHKIDVIVPEILLGLMGDYIFLTLPFFFMRKVYEEQKILIALINTKYRRETIEIDELAKYDVVDYPFITSLYRKLKLAMLQRILNIAYNKRLQALLAVIVYFISLCIMISTHLLRILLIEEVYGHTYGFLGIIYRYYVLTIIIPSIWGINIGIFVSNLILILIANTFVVSLMGRIKPEVFKPIRNYFEIVINITSLCFTYPGVLILSSIIYSISWYLADMPWYYSVLAFIIGLFATSLVLFGIIAYSLYIHKNMSRLWKQKIIYLEEALRTQTDVLLKRIEGINVESLIHYKILKEEYEKVLNEGTWPFYLSQWIQMLLIQIVYIILSYILSHFISQM